MIIGTTLNALAARITEQAQAKRDFIADTRKVRLSPEPEMIGGNGAEVRNPAVAALEFNSGASQLRLQLTDLALRQVGERAGIPAKYLEKMTGAGNRELLALNVNHWFDRNPEKRMIRGLCTADRQTARAFLSDRFRPLDNFDLMNAVLPRLIDAGCEVKSAECTERRLYLQAVTPRLEISASTKRNDPMQAGIVISNSEVGCGSIKVEPLLFRLVCKNGLIVPDAGVKKYHVGRQNNAGDELEAAAEYFSDRTRELNDRAFWAKVNDVVTATLDRGRFESLVQKFASTEAVKIGNPVDAVEVVTKRLALSEGESKSVLGHLASGGDLSLFGLVNAVTRTAEDATSYDRAIELERAGWEVVELPQSVFTKN